MRPCCTLFCGARLLRRYAPRNDEPVIASAAKQSRAFTAAFAGMTMMAAALAAPAAADDEPKYGGTLTYLIPADAPPSFDAHREGTFATVHSAAPFYSVLIRVDP